MDSGVYSAIVMEELAKRRLWIPQPLVNWELVNGVPTKIPIGCVYKLSPRRNEPFVEIVDLVDTGRRVVTVGGVTQQVPQGTSLEETQRYAVETVLAVWTAKKELEL